MNHDQVPDHVPSTTRRVPRRLLLGGIGAGGAVTALGLSLGSTAGPAAAASLKNGRWTNPARGRLSSAYGWRTLNGERMFHAGWDIANSTGTAVYAAAAGTVVRRGSGIIGGRTGNALLVSHGSGVYTYYGHLSTFRASLNESVAAGELIADMGATGNVTGPHLHFEVHVGGIGDITDPRTYVARRGVDLGGGFCTLDPNAGGQKVRAVQYLLKRRGHNVLVDGDYGSETTGAVRSFQSAKGLVVDGQTGPKTWRKLIYTLQQGAGGDHVKALQTLLNTHSAGLLVDGDFGSVTTSAVKNFQQRNRLVRDGLAGPITWEATAG